MKCSRCLEDVGNAYLETNKGPVCDDCRDAIEQMTTDNDLDELFDEDYSDFSNGKDSD